MYSITRAIIFALMVIKPAITIADNLQETCLAKTVYYECRGCKNQIEKLDIAKLVINRTKNDNFSHTVCGVVNQKNQFKWASTKQKITDKKSWEESKRIAKKVLKNPNSSRLPDNVVFFKLKSSDVKLANNISRVKFKDKRDHDFYAMKG